MDDNIRLLPKTSNQHLLAQYYSMADAFVICSSRENFPTTCVEAQCCGAPVVGFDTGGTRETSVDDTDDFVPYGDLVGLKERVTRAFQKDKKDISRKAIARYDRHVMAESYLRAYDKNGRKQRILLIDVNCKNSSTGKIVYDLYNEIRADGRNAAICYGRGPEVEGENIYKFGLDAETSLHAGLARLTGYNGYFSPVSTKRLIDYIDSFHPDLIHIHELHAYFVNIRPLLEHIKQKHIPVVWTFHCEYMYTGKCGYANDCYNFQTGCGSCPYLKAYPKSFFFDRTRQMLEMKKKTMDGLNVDIIAPSQWLRDRAKKSFLNDKQVSVINNGIDTDTFHPLSTGRLRSELHISSHSKVVLALAPDIMSERKGGEWVMKLAAAMQSDDITFLLVGNE